MQLLHTQHVINIIIIIIIIGKKNKEHMPDVILTLAKRRIDKRETHQFFIYVCAGVGNIFHEYRSM